MKLTLALLLALFLGPNWVAQAREVGSVKTGIHVRESLKTTNDNTEQASPAQSNESKPLTNADVVSMVKARLAESTIVLSIQHSSTAFNTSPQDLISLQNEGVPTSVLNAMVAAASGKVSPAVPAPAPAPPPDARSPKPAQGASIKTDEVKAPVPDMHKIRKVVLQMDWADDENARAHAMQALAKHTCLRVVDDPKAADAVLIWTNQGLMGVALHLESKDGQELWNSRGFWPPLKALSQVVGCPK
jgi:hypothetical protein